MRFICVEPMLEPVRLDLRGIAWVIVGGESGPRARHMPAEWARDVRDQCRAAGVALFVKQMCRREAIPHDLLNPRRSDDPRVPIIGTALSAGAVGRTYQAPPLPPGELLRSAAGQTFYALLCCSASLCGLASRFSRSKRSILRCNIGSVEPEAIILVGVQVFAS